MRLDCWGVGVDQSVNGTLAGVIPSTALQERIFKYVSFGCVISFIVIQKYSETVDNTIDIGG
jgi:hypothetical protein